MRVRAALGAGIVTCLCAANARAQAGLLVPTSVNHPDASVLSLREMAIDVGIARGYARVNVRQVFENHTDAVQEGTYRFALPPSAAIGDFAVWDGIVRIPGIILEKRRARAIYRDLTTRRIDPGLLQQGEEDDRPEGEGPAKASGGALFSVKVAPIPARATKRLEIQFQQEAPILDGVGEFRLVLRPPDGEAPVAGTLTVSVRLEDGAFVDAPGALALKSEPGVLAHSSRNVTLDRDLIVRFRPSTQAPLRLSAFRNPDGRLPDGLALAPWERPSDVPLEKDGFFLFEILPPTVPSASPSPGNPTADRPRRKATSLAILFDTSLSHRFSGLESSYSLLVDVLRSLRPDDRFALIPFDDGPAPGGLENATPAAVDAALVALRSRPLGPGTDLAAAVGAARSALRGRGRVLLLTDGALTTGSTAIAAALGDARLFTAVAGSETLEALRNASVSLITPLSSEPERRLFLDRLLGDADADKPKPSRRAGAQPLPFAVTGGDPQLRDVYPVLVQPPTAGSLSGFVGRYAAPQEHVRFALTDGPLAAQSLEAALPARALDARDLPRRWARARVDDLLRRIEAEGERREWVDEIIALSRRYKFVTPYTAFLAAPRSLLRPRRIQPGDPVLRVECDPGTVSATALFPFGLRLPLVRRPKTNLWEGRFLVPEGLKDGRYVVRILVRDRSGASVSESKPFVIDGTAPRVRPDIPKRLRAGETVAIAARADEDVLFLSARIGDGPSIPLRWDPKTRRSVGTWRVPAGWSGVREAVFEAVDGAKNHGFARAEVEVAR